MENAEAYIGLLIQVPLVGIFIWFTLKIVDRFLLSLDNRDKQWQSFLDAERKEMNEAMTNLAQRLGDEIKTIATEVARVNGVLSQHASADPARRVKRTE